MFDSRREWSRAATARRARSTSPWHGPHPMPIRCENPISRRRVARCTSASAVRRLSCEEQFHWSHWPRPWSHRPNGFPAGSPSFQPSAFAIAHGLGRQCQIASREQFLPRPRWQTVENFSPHSACKLASYLKFHLRPPILKSAPVQLPPRRPRAAERRTFPPGAPDFAAPR